MDSTPKRQGTGFTYYLMNQSFSIAGTGNSDGSVIERLDYSAGGDFGGPAAGYFFDADGDEDVDLNDYADFYPCLSGPDVDAGAACALHDFDGGDDVDLPDFDRLQRCFTGDGAAPPTVCLRSVAYYHDFDGDRDVDLDDYETGFYPCLGAEEPDARCLAIHDFDADGLSDGSVDMADYGGFVDCSANGSGQAPPESCLRSGFQDTPPAAGTFALHGRPVDVLSDDHVVQYSRARYYEPKHGRWLQRDPTGYADSGNLYEAFRANASRFTDPDGRYTKLASGWNNGDEVFYQHVWPWPFGIQKEFSVGKYHYVNGEKLIIYDEYIDAGNYVHVLSLRQVEQWSKKTDLHERDYEDFVRLNAVRFDRITGKVIERSLGEGLAAFFAQAMQEEYDRLEGLFSSLEPMNFIGGPFMMALTGEDIGREVSVPGRFRVLGGVITALEVAPGIYGTVRLFAVSRTPALASRRVSRAPRIAYDIRTAGLSADEVSAIREYARRVNAWLQEAGPQTIRSTAGRLRREASAAARAERVRAARAGRPYTGQAGHVPDTAISGMPDPPAGWLDMPGASNPAAGGGLGRRLGQRIDTVTVDGSVP